MAFKLSELQTIDGQTRVLLYTIVVEGDKLLNQSRITEHI